MKIVMRMLLGVACMGHAFVANDHLKNFSWHAPSTLNPYLSASTKDVDSSRVVLEPGAKCNQE